MNDARPTPNMNALAPIIQNLSESLSLEQNALSTLLGLFDQQIELLKRQDQVALEEVTLKVNEELALMDRHRQARERQANLLGRLLPASSNSLEALAEALREVPGGGVMARKLHDQRTALREQANLTRQRCEAFEFGLQYAMRLGRAMLQVIQDLDVPPPARLYTAAGQTTQASQRKTILNQVG